MGGGGGHLVVSDGCTHQNKKRHVFEEQSKVDVTDPENSESSVTYETSFQSDVLKLHLNSLER